MRVNPSLLLLLLLPVTASAQQQQQEQMPDQELLEFLGSFEMQDYGWLDNEMEQAKQTEQKRSGEDTSNE
ncbi:MAG: hypothetical protein PVG13_10635 [Thiohalophilus sp.]|jgi:hypothetical protein